MTAAALPSHAQIYYYESVINRGGDPDLSYKDAIKCKAYLERAYVRLEQGDYEDARKCLEEVLKLNPDDTDVPDLQDRIDQVMVERRLEEKRAWDDAKSTDTYSAYQQYLDRYPSGTYAAEATAAMDDMELWSHAVNLNSLEGYREYVAAPGVHKHKEEAEVKILKMECENSWLQVKDSRDVEAIENYIARYGDMAHKGEAERQLRFATGLRMLKRGDVTKGFELVKDNADPSQLTAEERQLLETSREKHDADLALDGVDPEACQAFLYEFPQSQYAEDVKNHLAVCLMRHWQPDDKEGLKVIRSYATRKTTKEIIKQMEKDKKK